MPDEMYSMNTRRAEQSQRIGGLLASQKTLQAKVERLEKRLARYKRVLDHHGIDPRDPIGSQADNRPE